MEEYKGGVQTYIKNFLAEGKNVSYKPLIFDLSQNSDRDRLYDLFSDGKIQHVVDEHLTQKEELILLQHPEIIEKKDRVLDYMHGSSYNEGRWVYYPWLSTLVHLLAPDDFEYIRTSRNNTLITPDEQVKLRDARVAIAGLNVGNPAAICMTLEGIAHTMKFADNDALDVSNLNRFRASVIDFGLNKAVLSARQAYEINPYAHIEIFTEGITSNNIENFVQSGEVDVLIEEMDHLPLKIQIRKKAKEHGVPVVMVTGNGSNVILDIERYDLDANIKIMNGFLKSEVLDGVQQLVDGQSVSIKEYVALCRDFIGEQYLTDRLKKSFSLIGESLVGIPQIAEASFLRGAILAYAVRKIILKEDVPSGRYQFRLESIWE